MAQALACLRTLLHLDVDVRPALWLGWSGDEWCTGCSTEIMAKVERGSGGDVWWDQQKLHIQTMEVTDALPLRGVAELIAHPPYQEMCLAQGAGVAALNWTFNIS